jgi:O-succinylbenzoic acid--CoA ligase
MESSILKIPGIRTPNFFLSSAEVRKEVVGRISYINKHHIDENAFLVLESSKSINIIFWILALLCSKRNFSVIEQNASADEIGPFERIDPQAHIESNGDALISPEPFLEAKIVIFSSGSTGKKTAVSLTIENLRASAFSHAAHLRQTTNDVWLASLPFHHIGGVSILARAFFLNQDIFFDEHVSADSILTCIESNLVTGISLVPTLLQRILEIKKKQGKIFKSSDLRFALIGGDRTTSELLDEANKMNFPAIATYGLTEAASQVATETAPNQRGLRLLPGIQVRLSSEGELEIQGPSISSGQIVNGRYEANKSRWTPTGDIASIDFNNSTIEIVGRKKDIVISGGVKIIPLEVEAVFRKITGITTCVLLGIPNNEWGETALLLYENSTEITQEEQRQIKNILGPIKTPKTYICWKEIPKSSIGKISRFEVKQILSKLTSIEPSR